MLTNSWDCTWLYINIKLSLHFLLTFESDFHEPVLLLCFSAGRWSLQALAWFPLGGSQGYTNIWITWLDVPCHPWCREFSARCSPTASSGSFQLEHAKIATSNIPSWPSRFGGYRTVGWDSWYFTIAKELLRWLAADSRGGHPYEAHTCTKAGLTGHSESSEKSPRSSTWDSESSEKSSRSTLCVSCTDDMNLNSLHGQAGTLWKLDATCMILQCMSSWLRIQIISTFSLCATPK